MSAQSNYYVPYVIEKTGRGERTYDIYSRLLEDRIIFIGTQVDDAVANSVMAQLLFLDKSNKSQDINIYINSPGGSVTAGLAIYDTMQFVQPDVATYCLAQGTAMDMEIHVTEIIKLKKVLEGILGKHTGRSAEEISKESERDHFFAAEDAKNFGLIDHVVEAAGAKPDDD